MSTFDIAKLTLENMDEMIEKWKKEEKLKLSKEKRRERYRKRKSKTIFDKEVK